ncbi:NUDIX domain-containing protein [Pseudoalteromonas sp. SMS1]|uniref:NUDIX domain-containing protein n=1 Tax=Pseudoalteromonas sp. SMS1 TaxID=2908894 RepID=UPI001F206001|nr:NUDIX domain-containing protein [Pseudoalteromonas sp. SMS1]MCF2858105.1 NUDIX domain-containing protein [Pseudoalteromonas sp. SMS1]
MSYTRRGVKGIESLEEAVVREVKEETGLNVTVNKLMYIEQMYTPEERSVKFWYHCDLVGGALDCTAVEAVSEFIVDTGFKDKSFVAENDVFPPMLKSGFWDKVEQDNVQPEVIQLRQLAFY